MSSEAPKLTDTNSDSDRIRRRREKVRNNVRALRQRRKEAAKLDQDCKFDAFGLNGHCRNNNQITNPILKNGSSHISLGCELSDSKMEWKLNLPYRLSAGSSSQDAYIAAFRHYCRAPQSSDGLNGEDVYIAICCGSWVQSICMQSANYETSLISQALSASGLATIGAIRQDMGMLCMAENAQNGVLSALRHLINKYSVDSDRKRLHFISIALLTCAITDLLVNKSWTTFSLHLDGVGALIESAGTEALSSLKAFDNFQGYRSVQLTFSFVERKASFLSLPEWTKLPSPSIQSLHEIQMGQLLDIIYQIPELMQIADAKTSSHIEEEDDSGDDLQHVLTRITEVADSLDSWDTAFSSQSSCSRLNQSLPTSDKPWEQEVIFADRDHAKFSAYSCGARVALYEMALTVSKSQSRARSLRLENSIQDYAALTYQWAVRGCQCLNYLSRQQSNVAGKLYALFCLDMTWRAMNLLHGVNGLACAEELCWCEALAVKLGQTGLPVLRTHSCLAAS